MRSAPSNETKPAAGSPLARARGTLIFRAALVHTACGALHCIPGIDGAIERPVDEGPAAVSGTNHGACLDGQVHAAVAGVGDALHMVSPRIYLCGLIVRDALPGTSLRWD